MEGFLPEFQSFLNEFGVSTGLLFGALITATFVGALAFREFSCWLNRTGKILNSLESLHIENRKLQDKIKELKIEIKQKPAAPPMTNSMEPPSDGFQMISYSKKNGSKNGSKDTFHISN